MSKKTAADLRVGETATISGFNNEKLSLKLLEMGCLPGGKITFRMKAPLGDPICVEVAGYRLSLRKNEAKAILVENN
jgi:ferrous iron transport protein A